MHNTKKSEKASSQSSVRLLQIMECMAKNRSPMRLLELSRQVEMTQSTVTRYLQALQDENYVYQDEDSRYGLTWKICQLSEEAGSYASLRTICFPFISSIGSSFQLGVCLVVNQNDECIYLDCIDSSNSLFFTLQHIGKRAPLHATGSGKVLLSSYTQAQIDGYIRQKGLSPVTEYTITDRERLLKELETVRERGYGTDEEECELGLRCISFPLRSYSGKIIAAISVLGSTAGMSGERIQNEICPALRQITGIISRRLGYTGE